MEEQIGQVNLTIRPTSNSTPEEFEELIRKRIDSFVKNTRMVQLGIPLRNLECDGVQVRFNIVWDVEDSLA